MHVHHRRSHHRQWHTSRLLHRMCSEHRCFLFGVFRFEDSVAERGKVVKRAYYGRPAHALIIACVVVNNCNRYGSVT